MGRKEGTHEVAGGLAGTGLVTDLLEGRLGRPGGRPGIHERTGLRLQQLEEGPLTPEQIRPRHQAVPGAYHAGLQRLGRRQRPHQVGDARVAHGVVWPVHAGVAREQDAFPGQPREAVAAGVRDAQVEQLHAHRAVVHDELVPEQQGGRRQARGAHVRARRRLGLPTARGSPKEPGLVPPHLGEDALMRDDGGPLRDPRLVAVGVVAVVVRVEGEADGLGRGCPDLGEDVGRARGEVGVDDEHLVAQDDPAVVGMAASDEVALMKPHAGGHLLGLAHLGEGQRRGGRGQREGQGERQACVQGGGGNGAGWHGGGRCSGQRRPAADDGHDAALGNEATARCVAHLLGGDGLVAGGLAVAVVMAEPIQLVERGLHGDAAEVLPCNLALAHDLGLGAGQLLVREAAFRELPRLVAQLGLDAFHLARRGAAIEREVAGDAPEEVAGPDVVREAQLVADAHEQ